MRNVQFKQGNCTIPSNSQHPPGHAKQTHYSTCSPGLSGAFLGAHLYPCHMYMYMCICVYVCMYVCVYIYISPASASDHVEPTCKPLPTRWPTYVITMPRRTQPQLRLGRSVFHAAPALRGQNMLLTTPGCRSIR